MFSYWETWRLEAWLEEALIHLAERIRTGKRVLRLPVSMPVEKLESFTRLITPLAVVPPQRAAQLSRAVTVIFIIFLLEMELLLLIDLLQRLIL
jgi:hypothetical protein